MSTTAANKMSPESRSTAASSGRIPVSDRSKELYAMASVMSQFPVAFESGAQWGSFRGVCSCCGNPVLSDRMRGSVSHPIPSVYVIEAVGVCEPCRTLTQYNYRLHEDMRITGLSNDGWRTWAPKRDFSFARALKQILKFLF